MVNLDVADHLHEMQNAQNIFGFIIYLCLTYSQLLLDHIPHLCYQEGPLLAAPLHPVICTTLMTWTTTLIPIKMKYLYLLITVISPHLPIMNCLHLLITINSLYLLIPLTTPLLILIHLHPDQCLLFPLKLPTYFT